MKKKLISDEVQKCIKISKFLEIYNTESKDRSQLEMNQSQ